MFLADAQFVLLEDKPIWGGLSGTSLFFTRVYLPDHVFYGEDGVPGSGGLLWSDLVVLVQI